MSTVIRPFGWDNTKAFYGREVATLQKIKNAATAGTYIRHISSPISFLRSGTASTKRKLSLTFADDLPAGAILYVNHQTARACGLVLGTGFVKATLIGSEADTKGTGNWVCGFLYNGTGFIQITRDNLRLGYKSHPLKG